MVIEGTFFVVSLNTSKFRRDKSVKLSEIYWLHYKVDWLIRERNTTPSKVCIASLWRIATSIDDVIFVDYELNCLCEKWEKQTEGFVVILISKRLSYITKPINRTNILSLNLCPFPSRFPLLSKDRGLTYTEYKKERLSTRENNRWLQETVNIRHKHQVSLWSNELVKWLNVTHNHKYESK